MRHSDTIRYDTIEEFNVDKKAECGKLNLTHVTRYKKNKKKKLKQTQRRVIYTVTRHASRRIRAINIVDRVLLIATRLDRVYCNVC